MRSTCIAAALAAFAALPARAQSASEDAARIEVLIGLEQAAKRGGTFAPVGPGPAAAVSFAAASAPGIDAAPLAARAPTGVPEAPAPSDLPPAEAAGVATLADGAVDPGEPPLVYENPAARPADPNEIALDALGHHVGQSVRVRSHGGRTRVGTIESVGAEGVTLKSPMGGGYARYTLPYSQITRVEKR